VPDAYALTPRAKIDLGVFWRYIAADNTGAADSVEAAMYQAFDLLSKMPNTGHRRRDLTDRPLRFWLPNPYKTYLIVYDAEIRPIRIIRVLHAALDAKSLLSK
jgi:plasmid stabilization system protein ParE